MDSYPELGMEILKKNKGEEVDTAQFSSFPAPLLCSFVSVYVSDFYAACFSDIEWNKKH